MLHGLLAPEAVRGCQLSEEESGSEKGQLSEEESGSEKGQLSEEESGSEKGQLSEEESGSEKGQLSEEESGSEKGQLSEEESGSEKGQLSEEESGSEKGQLSEEESGSEKGQLSEEESGGEKGQLSEEESGGEKGQLSEEESGGEKGQLSEEESESGGEKGQLSEEETAQNVTNATRPEGRQFLTDGKWTGEQEKEEEEDSTSSRSLSARRSACFQTASAAASDAASAADDSGGAAGGAAGGGAGAGGGGVNVSSYLSLLPWSPVACNDSLLVQRTLAELWARQSTPLRCLHREAYGEVSQCLLEATKSCLPAENIQGHFPDSERVKAGLRYICQVAAADQYDMDMACARALLRPVLECIREDLQQVLGSPSLPSAFLPPHLVCRTFDIADLCYWETLQTCGEVTAATYTRMMSLYFRPPSCFSSASKLNAIDAVTSHIFSVISVAWILYLYMC
ncbi:hypothetical protein ACOMHN_020935 [Nucella lapillus]